MTSLRWGVKTSLLEYVRAMPDGRIECVDGVVETPQGFRFPDAGEGLAFRGEVRLIGHGGMMRVVLRDPALVRQDTGWMLSIADPDEPALRLPFADILDLEPIEGGRRAVHTALTEDGADLFFGPYRAGTVLADPIIEDGQPAPA